MSSYFSNPSFLLHSVPSADRCATLRWLWGVSGQQRSGLNYTDTLIGALGKVVLAYVWVCKELVNMYCNNAPQRKKSRSLCVNVFLTWKAGETEGWADKADQRTGLEKADKGACHPPFNEELDPISKGQQSLSKSPSCPLCWCYPPCYQLCLSVSTIPQTSLSRSSAGNLQLGGPLTPALIWQPRLC